MAVYMIGFVNRQILGLVGGPLVACVSRLPELRAFGSLADDPWWVAFVRANSRLLSRHLGAFPTFSAIACGVLAWST